MALRSDRAIGVRVFVCMLCVLFLKPTVGYTAQKFVPQSRLKGDYNIRTLYGCPGEHGRNGYADMCRQAVITSKMLYHLMLAKTETGQHWHVIPVKGKTDEYRIGSSCTPDLRCDRYWTYVDIINQIRTTTAAMTKFRITPRGGGYRIQVVENCFDEETLAGRYPCGYELSYTTRFLTKWLTITSPTEHVNFEFQKV